MTRFGTDSLATLEFVLRWQDHTAAHEERYLARRVNPWRDIFPPGLAEALENAQTGDAASMRYAPGEAVPAQDPAKQAVLPASDFTPPGVAGRSVPASVGRFYPQGLLRNIPHVHPQNGIPFRLTDMEGDTLHIDRNHPLAPFPLELRAEIQWVQEKRGDTGGQLSHWMEEICDFGPGMQAPLPGSDITLHDAFFSRLDPSDDGLFHARPRLVSHVDEQSSRNLQGFYSRFLEPGMRVLDLMSGRDSHLPEEPGLEVTGLGMNREELKSNHRLARAVVHDLNRDPALPDAVTRHAPFDAVLCSLSIEYLTDPVAVLESVRKNITPGGVLLVGFSDRWFPNKAVAGWMDLHPFERPGVTLQWMRRAGFDGAAGTFSLRNDWRPRNDPHFLETRGVSDPVFVAWSYKD